MKRRIFLALGLAAALSILLPRQPLRRRLNIKKARTLSSQESRISTTTIHTLTHTKATSGILSAFLWFLTMGSDGMPPSETACMNIAEKFSRISH